MAATSEDALAYHRSVVQQVIMGAVRPSLTPEGDRLTCGSCTRYSSRIENIPHPDNCPVGKLQRLMDSEGRVVDRTPRASCARCNCPYGSHGFHDLIVPRDIWHQISPTGNDGGLLCPTCILAALDDLGLKNVPVYLASGPAVLIDHHPDKPKEGTT